MGIKYKAPSKNFFSTTLNGAISDSASTITLTSVTNLLSPGYLVLDREDGSGNATSGAREVIVVTGISSNDLTGVTRGADGSTARSHNDGALVESMMTVGVWNSLVSIVDLAVDDVGYLRPLESPASISTLGIGTALNVPGITTLTGEALVSAASVQGLGISPVWEIVGNFSGPTTFLRTPITMPRAGTWESFTILTRTVASVSSVAVDVNKAGVSIFDTVGRPSFLPAATMASTASIKTKPFKKGDQFTVDIDLPAAGETGHVTDVTIIGNAI